MQRVKETSMITLKENGTYGTAAESQVCIGWFKAQIVTDSAYVYDCGHVYVYDRNIEERMAYAYADGSIRDTFTGLMSVKDWTTEEFNHITKKYVLKDMTLEFGLMKSSRKNVQKVDTPCIGCVSAIGHKMDFVIHGLSAYRVTSLAGMKERLQFVLENKDNEVCFTSNIYPGPVGVGGYGDITAYFYTDICSFKRKTNGQRGVTPTGCERLRGEGRMSTHDEYWVKQFTPTEFWVKRWYWDSLSDTQKEELETMKDMCLVSNITFID